MSFQLTQQDVAYFSYASLINYSHCADIWCNRGGKLIDDPLKATWLFACDQMDALSSSVITCHPIASPPGPDKPGTGQGKGIWYEPIAIYHPDWIQVSQQTGVAQPLEEYQIQASLTAPQSSPTSLPVSSAEPSRAAAPAPASQVPKAEDQASASSALDAGKAPLPLQLGKRTRALSSSLDSDISEVEEQLRFASEEPLPPSSLEALASSNMPPPCLTSEPSRAPSKTPMPFEFVEVPLRSTPAPPPKVQKRTHPPPPPPPPRQASPAARERRTSARLTPKKEDEGLESRNSTSTTNRRRLFKTPLRPRTEQESNAGPSRLQSMLGGSPEPSSSIKHEE